mgnify:CR=1 FL=1
MAGAYLGMDLYPYYEYYQTIHQQMPLENKLIKLSVSDRKWVKIPYKKYPEKNGMMDDDASKWRVLQFSQYLIPLPVHHPLFTFLPTVQKQGLNLELGLSITDLSGKIYFSVQTGKREKWDMSLPDDLLFKTAEFKKFMGNRERKDIWAEVLKKDLHLNLNLSDSFLAMMKKVKAVSSMFVGMALMPFSAVCMASSPLLESIAGPQVSIFGLFTAHPVTVMMIVGIMFQ